MSGAGEANQEALPGHRAAVLTTLGGLALAACGVQYLVAGYPQIWAPYPTATFVPLFALAISGFHKSFALLLCSVVPITLFWLLGFRLFRGRARIPRFAWILVAIFGCLELVYLAFSWDYGMRIQGLAHTVAVSLLTVGVFATSVVVLVMAQRRSSFTMTFAGCWLFCFWLGWFAFPYLGELV